MSKESDAVHARNQMRKVVGPKHSIMWLNDEKIAEYDGNEVKIYEPNKIYTQDTLPPRIPEEEMEKLVLWWKGRDREGALLNLDDNLKIELKQIIEGQEEELPPHLVSMWMSRLEDSTGHEDLMAVYNGLKDEMFFKGRYISKEYDRLHDILDNYMSIQRGEMSPENWDMWPTDYIERDY